MLHHSRKDGRTAFAAAGPAAAVVVAGLFAIACEQATTGPPEQATVVEPAAISASVTAKAEDLLALQRATERFRDFHNAFKAGYQDELTGCVEQQGFHYAKLSLFDGTVSLREPEVLMYEPMAHGRMRLVGVEYIVPTALSPHPPSLLGQAFAENTELGIWFLHVWVWRHNPSGMFADDNPRVSCKNAA